MNGEDPDAMREMNLKNAENKAGAEPADADLIRRIAVARDRQAFEMLYLRYAGRIKGVMIRAGAAPDEGDEAAQEAMLSVWRRAETFDPARAGAATWIFAIARNRRIDMIRRAARPEPDPHDPLFRPDPPTPPDAAVAIADRDRAVRAAVAALSPAQTEVIHLAFFQGLSHHQAAERTGAPLGTVKSRLRLAVERLRAALGDDFGEELLND